MTSILRTAKPSHLGLHRYTTEEIEAEILRREAATDAQKVRAAISGTWEAVEAIASRAGIPKRECVDALQCLAESGKAFWKISGPTRVWRLAK